MEKGDIITIAGVDYIVSECSSYEEICCCECDFGENALEGGCSLPMADCPLYDGIPYYDHLVFCRK